MPICTEPGAINFNFEGPCDHGFGPDYNLQNAINTINSPGLSGISELYDAFSSQLELGNTPESVPGFMDYYYLQGNTLPNYGDWRARQNTASRLGTKKLYEERIKGMQEFEPIVSGFESDYFGGRQDLLEDMQDSTAGIIQETGAEVFDIGSEYVDILNTAFGQYDFSTSDSGAWEELGYDEQFDFLSDQIQDYQTNDPAFFETGAYEQYQQCLEDSLTDEDSVTCAEIVLGFGG